jgi:mono/diheme cytochrome c family protein
MYTRTEPTQQDKLLNEYYTNAVLASTDLYATNCAVCHGAAGEGIGDIPALYTEAVRMMSAWGSRLTDQEIHSLVAFLRSKVSSAPAILPPILSD